MDDYGKGFDSLKRYIFRCIRAISCEYAKEDIYQAILLLMVKSFGRDRFDRIVIAVGRGGFAAALPPGSPEFAVFKRAVWSMLRAKRREKTYFSIREYEESLAATQNPYDALRSDLAELVDTLGVNKYGFDEREFVLSLMNGDAFDGRWEEGGRISASFSNRKYRLINRLREMAICS